MESTKQCSFHVLSHRSGKKHSGDARTTPSGDRITVTTPIVSVGLRLDSPRKVSLKKHQILISFLDELHKFHYQLCECQSCGCKTKLQIQKQAGKTFSVSQNFTLELASHYFCPYVLLVRIEKNIVIFLLILFAYGFYIIFPA